MGHNIIILCSLVGSIKMKKNFEWVPLKMILFKDTIFKNGIYLYREPLNNKPFFFTRLMYEIDP